MTSDDDTTVSFSVGDDNFDDTDQVTIAPTTLLSSLKEAMATELAVPPIRVVVPKREGWEIEYIPSISSEHLNAWRKQSKDRAYADDVNDLKFAALVLANTCSGICSGDVFAETEDGERATFRTRDLWPEGATRAVEAIRAFFGRDADIAMHAAVVLREAGYDPDGEDLVRPTMG